jgi:hypothetical protein
MKYPHFFNPKIEYSTLFFMAICFIVSTTLSSQTYQSTGLSTDWNNPDSWDCSGGGCNSNPTPGNDLRKSAVIVSHYIEYISNNPIRVRNNGSITIHNKGELIMSSNLNLDAGGEVRINRGNLNIGPGVFNLNGNLILNKAIIVKDGNLNNNGSMDINESCITLLDGKL